MEVNVDSQKLLSLGVEKGGNYSLRDFYVNVQCWVRQLGLGFSGEDQEENDVLLFLFG